MNRDGFPSLKTGPEDPFFEIDQLGTHPEQWKSAPIAELGRALVVYATIWARQAYPNPLTRPLGALHSTFEERASEQDRLEVVQAIAAHAEKAARELRSGKVAAALMLFLSDPSPLVISSAALAMAGLATTDESDDMAGPRLVAGFATQDTNQRRRAAIFAGLLAMGDPRVSALIGDCWRTLDDEGRELLVQLGGGGVLPTPAKLDFFLRWAETAVTGVDEGVDGLGHAMAAVARLGRQAAEVAPDGDVTGILDVDRAFPAWSAPPDAVVTLKRRWSKEEFAATIAPRLIDIARKEKFPRVAPVMLQAWGLPDVPHVEAVAEAVEPLAGSEAETTVLETPAEVRVRPTLDQPNQVMEWGILNPSGPTMCQLALVEIGARRHVLVWTLHHFLLPQCLAIAVGRLDDPATLRKALAEVFPTNGGSRGPLIKSLPHWVRLPEHSPLDVETVAALIGAAHRRQLESDELVGEHPDAILAHLWRLARNPIEECNGEQERAFRDWGPVMKAIAEGEKETADALIKDLRERQRLPELPDDDAYRRWARFATEAAYVENVRSYFESAWAEAIRRLSAGRDHETPQEPPAELYKAESAGE